MKGDLPGWPSTRMKRWYGSDAAAAAATTGRDRQQIPCEQSASDGRDGHAVVTTLTLTSTCDDDDNMFARTDLDIQRPGVNVVCL